MKKILLITIILLSNALQAQFWKDNIRGNGKIATEERSLSSFNQLTVTGPFDVMLRPGAEGKLSLTADENLLPVIETFVKNNKLVIRFNKDFNVRKATKLFVEVPVKYLKSINLTGSGSIKNERLIDWNEINLYLTGSGDMMLNLNLDFVKASVTGSGDMVLNGTANNARYSVTGSGSINAKQAICKNAKVNVTGSGDVYVKATQRLKGKLLGSGDLYYYAKPETLDINILGSGSVIDKTK